LSRCGYLEDLLFYVPKQKIHTANTCKPLDLFITSTNNRKIKMNRKTAHSANLWVFALASTLAFPQTSKAGNLTTPYQVQDMPTHQLYKQTLRSKKPPLQAEYNAYQYPQESGQDPPPNQYDTTQTKPGMSPQARPGSSYTFQDGTPQTKAKKEKDGGQPTGTPVGTILHTLYSYNIGLPGPPDGRPYWMVFHPQMADPGTLATPPQYYSYLPNPVHMTESDAQHALYAMAGSDRAAAKMLQPEMQTIRGQMQGFTQQVADGAGTAQRNGFQANVNIVQQSLINVANEESGTPVSGSGDRTIPQAIWIVEQMYIRFYVPLAILLLLVGAVLTQTGNTVKNTVAAYALMEQPDAFQGPIRGATALVLMALVPLIVSWGIDIGNSLTYSVTQVIQMETLTSWFNDVCPDRSGQSIGQQTDQANAETTMAATTRAVFSCMATFLNYGLMVLVAYQLVIVCYLYLLGPMAAAFYAWPGSIGSLFKPVFNNWLNALTNLVLWRFWWCVILLCMVVRINWLKDIGAYDPNSPWEPLVYTAFMVMLAYVPFHALEFKPGDLVDQLMQKAQVGQSQ
jgi:hypothetical protein